MNNSKKFHIGKSGKPSICRAKEGNCKFGSDNPHFSTELEAQNYSDLLNEKETLLKSYKEKPSLKTVLSLRKVNEALGKEPKDGLSSGKEKEKERKLEFEKKRIEELKNYNSFLNKEYLELPETIDENYLGSLKNYSKMKYSSNVYRGEMDSYNGVKNTGIAMYGSGLYTTTNRKYASMYGKVRVVSTEELPSIPLVLKDGMSFNHFVNETCKKYGFSKSLLSEDISRVIVKMGYDGLVFGDKKNMIIVKYNDI